MTHEMLTSIATPIDASVRAGKRDSRVLLRGAVVAAAAAAFVAGIGSSAFAAPIATPVGPTIANVGVTAGITMTGLTPSFTLTGTPGATVSQAGAVIFNVETNNVAGYAVTVHSESPNLVGTGVLVGGVANADVIPITALTVKDSTAATYVPLGTTTAGVPTAGTVTVHTQAGRSANGGDALSSDYSLRIPVVNVDTYSATLDYVATTL